MASLLVRLGAAAALVAGGLFVSPAAQAAPTFGGDAARVAADGISLTDSVQYVVGGRRYCWYVDGWRGPGWYWCGYSWRRGYGWGGGYGWRGWHHPGYRAPRPYVRPAPGFGRPGPGYGRSGPGYGRPVVRPARPHVGRPMGGGGRVRHAR